MQLISCITMHDMLCLDCRINNISNKINMQNVIKREVLIKASKEKIYEAIANPEQVIKWFPNAIEGKYQVGEHPLFVFEGHGKAQVYIVEAKPYEHFAYRWIPGGSNFVGDVTTVPNTLVEFTIHEEGDGICKVVMVESGFAGLPTEMAENAFKQNSGGWDFMLGRLEKFFQA
jgi:uncharacterized protein YndB with AHSA1/START domain